MKNLKTQKFLSQLYDTLNMIAWDRTLPQADILLSKKNRNQKSWQTFFENGLVIEIDYISLMDELTDIEVMIENMLHEMVHIYAQCNNIKDTTRQGRYHNLKFRLLAEEHGLLVVANKSTGTDVVGIETSILESVISKFPTIEREMLNARKELGLFIEDIVYFYKCPLCHTEIKCDKNTKILCGYCYVEMEQIMNE